MAIAPETEDRLLRYLLGELTPEETHEVESQYFKDDELFEWLQFVEDELLRDYVKGQMAPDLRRRFVGRYLDSPVLIQKIKITETVLAESASLRSDRSTAAIRIESVIERQGRNTKFSVWQLVRMPAFHYASAAAVVLLMSTATFSLWTQTSSLRSAVTELQRENVTLEQERSKLARDLSEKPKQPLLVASFILNPGLSRSAGTALLVIPAGIGMVQLKLPLPVGAQYRIYRIELRNSSAGEVSSQDVGEAAVVDSGRSLLVSIPSVSLSPGQYLIHLRGGDVRGEFENVQYYAFSIKN